MKRAMLAACSLSILAAIALGISLPGLHLRPAMPLAAAPGGQGQIAVGPPPGGFDAFAVLRVVFLAGLAASLVAIVASLFSRSGRRRLLSMAIVLLVFLLAQEVVSIVVPAAQRGQPPPRPDLPSSVTQPAAAQGATISRDQAAPGWMTWLIAGGGILLVGIGAAGIVRVLRRTTSPDARALLAARTQSAAEELARGGDLRDVIMRCYRDMGAIVEEAKGIRRHAAATPTEFAALLEGAGLPAEPVRDLTRVFEEVRYGGGAPGPGAEERARECLLLITRSCEEAA